MCQNNKHGTLPLHTLCGQWRVQEMGWGFGTRTCNKISLSTSLMIILTSKSLFCGVPSSPELSSTLAALWRSCIAVLVCRTAASHGQCMCRKLRYTAATPDVTSVTQLAAALHSHFTHRKIKHSQSNECISLPFCLHRFSLVSRMALGNLHEGSSLLS